MLLNKLKKNINTPKMEWKRIIMENKFSFSMVLLYFIIFAIVRDPVGAGMALPSLVIVILFDQFTYKKRNPLKYIKKTYSKPF